MSEHDDERDLQALRAFRAHEAEPPPGLQAQIEEVLLQDVLAAEARLRSAPHSRTTRGSWLEGLLRPATAIGLAVSIAAVLAVATSGGGVPASQAPATASSSGSGPATRLLDATAAALFGGESAAAVAPSDATATAGDIPLQHIPVETAVQGTEQQGGGTATNLPRDPDMLRDVLERSAAAATGTVGGDAADRMAFMIGMSWVVDPSRPPELRAAFVRAIGGLDGLDDVTPSTDLFGRRGVVIGHVDAITGIRDQYVLDANGGELLERRSFTTAYVEAACPPGTFTAYEAFDGGQVISRDQAQWAAWPSVIEACDPGIVAP